MAPSTIPYALKNPAIHTDLGTFPSDLWNFYIAFFFLSKISYSSELFANHKLKCTRILWLYVNIKTLGLEVSREHFLEMESEIQV